ncbi:unnamed protein product [Amoebophrya sp. A25]|nr:unnamed protein product [Amoebophrya sp. A25]|eukprot:GSA25T00018289001.1
MLYVSSRQDLYGFGGGYHRFAGRVVTRSFAKTALDEEHIGRSDLADLGVENFVALREWEARFQTKYRILGQLEESHPDVRSPEELERLEREHGISRTLQGRNNNTRGDERERGEQSVLNPNINEAADENDQNCGPSILIGTPASPSYQENNSSAARRASRILSLESPSAFVLENFLSAEECRALQSVMLKSYEGKTFSTKLRLGLAPDGFPEGSETRALLQTIEDRLGALLACPPHEGENPLMAMLTTPSKGGAENYPKQPELHIGVHLDVNRRKYRFATGIIYLSDVAEGGETVFIKKGEETKLLHDSGVLHTDLIPEEDEEVQNSQSARPTKFPVRLPPENEQTSSATSIGTSTSTSLLLDATTPPLLSDEQYLEKWRPLQKAKRAVLRDPNLVEFKVAPKAGSLLVFFTRKPDLSICTASYHGGAAVRKGFKFTLQKFKELPRTTEEDVFNVANEWKRIIERALENCGRECRSAERI